MSFEPRSSFGPSRRNPNVCSVCGWFAPGHASNCKNAKPLTYVPSRPRVWPPVDEYERPEPVAPVRVAPVAKPKRKYDDPAEVLQFLTKVCLFRDSSGWIDGADDSPVYVGVALEVDSYGPHIATVCVDQNQFRMSADPPLQEAVELLEADMREHQDEYLKDLVEEHGEEDGEVMFTENIQGRTFVLDPVDAAAIFDKLKADSAAYARKTNRPDPLEGITIEECVDCPEDFDGQRCATTKCRQCSNLLCVDHANANGICGACADEDA